MTCTRAEVDSQLTTCKASTSMIAVCSSRTSTIDVLSSHVGAACAVEDGLVSSMRMIDKKCDV